MKISEIITALTFTAIFRTLIGLVPAALIAIPYSYKSPQSYIETNAIGTLNVLQSAQKNRVKKIIHTSTSEVYGTAQTIPIKENHPLVGQSPYAASKISADQIAISMNKSLEGKENRYHNCSPWWPSSSPWRWSNGIV